MFYIYLIPTIRTYVNHAQIIYTNEICEKHKPSDTQISIHKLFVYAQMQIICVQPYTNQNLWFCHKTHKSYDAQIIVSYTNAFVHKLPSICIYTKFV